MIYSAYSDNQKYRATVSEEHDDRDEEFNRTYFTLKVFDQELNQTIYQTDRYWVTDQDNEYQDGMEVQDVGFDEQSETLLINKGLTSPNCVPFLRIIHLVDDILTTFPDEVDAYKAADNGEGERPDLPVPLIEMIRQKFNGMGQPHDWMGQLESRIGEDFGT